MALVLADFGLEFILKQEGKARWNATVQKYFPYKDQIGKLTIGCGHLIRPGEDFTSGIDEGGLKSLLSVDVQSVLKAIQDTIHVPLTAHQIAALASWLFNCGVGWAYKSTLVQELNKGNYQVAAHWLEAFDIADGEHKNYLLARRKSEEALFNLPDNSTDAQKSEVLQLALDANIIKMVMAQQFDLTSDLGLELPSRSD